ncbi:MAG: hypothetical protein M1814_006397 [Vezdaea aestivalis]|nr:MAG: hypothetical protein M1814_006397 [Vezdaea aestivalis]
MALFNPTFILGLIVLLYLSTFILFAILRIVTGISIQRIGYFSLRHIEYTLRDGARLEIRGLGVLLHRPTFAQPTWVSLVLKELKLTLDLKSLAADGDEVTALERNGVIPDADGPHCALNHPDSPSRPSFGRSTSFTGRSQTWDRLTSTKEQIKRLHRKINWLRAVDLVATNTILNVTDVGCFQIGSFTMAVDTRRKTVDRGRLFHHGKPSSSSQRPAEWMFTVRSALFTPAGKEALEILDHCSLNIHGFLFRELDGLRDASISLKLGRLRIPYDDLVLCFTRYQGCFNAYGKRKSSVRNAKAALSELVEELEVPGSREEKIVQTVSDSKEFISSIMRGIKEFQFAVSSVGLTKRYHSHSDGNSIYVNASMNEIGLDLHRLDPHSPAHRMYFSPRDIAHQALLALISISVGIENSEGHTERLLYVPMVTTTVKTTLPSKTLETKTDTDAAERNANMLFANLVITSPSLDFNPSHLPILLDLLTKNREREHSHLKDQHHIISRLLPKASIKLSIQEPVVRVSLPAAKSKDESESDYDLLIMSVSSISFDAESSHSSAGELHYSLASSFRVSSLELYYQTALSVRYDLLLTESLELKVQVNATPDVRVVASGDLRTFSVHMIRPEISEGVRQIVRQLNAVTTAKRTSPKPRSSRNFLRKLPPWLLHFQLQGSGFGVEIAGVDPQISENSRGFAFQLESWTAEYKAHKEHPASPKQRRSRATSQALNPDKEYLKVVPPSPKKHADDPTDGRRVAIHVRGLEGFIVESIDSWEQESFLNLPRFEVALSTSVDSQGPVFHVNSHVKTLRVNYSLYRHYSIGVAIKVLKRTFFRTSQDLEELQHSKGGPKISSHTDTLAPLGENVRPELFTVDFKASLIQAKATMPSDPPIMLQIFALDAGRHRWTLPFVRTKLTRFYAEPPHMHRVWARLVSLKNFRLDLRESRRKVGNGFQSEKSIDAVLDAIRIAVPHQVIVYKIIDNLINVVKASEQLFHRFKTGTNEYILDKKPQGPKKFPKITLRAKNLLFELEDGPFEFKLGLLYRVGLVEQKQRLAREEAFVAKVRRLHDQDQRRGAPHARTRSSRPTDRSTSRTNPVAPRSRSQDGFPTKQPTEFERRGRTMRYDPDGPNGLSTEAKLSIDHARQKLDAHNAESWKRRIDFAIKVNEAAMADVRSSHWGTDDIPDDSEETETVLDVPRRPALMSTFISDLLITIDKPSFPLMEYPHFLYRRGKSMPLDTKYALLVPLNLQVDMGETRMTLRDYPLPLIYIPGLKSSQSSRIPCWSLRTDFVIAEEFRDHQSQRHVKVNILPPSKIENSKCKTGFAIDVRRTVAPVKTYSDASININTSQATRFTWGTSYQPAIQDMMMIIETFTKPQIDPSERTGFWDKIRLVFHSRVNVAWKGDGDVQLMLKGSRDPYMVQGHGAGFVMCWRNDVRWSLWQHDDPQKFMTVDSGEYILAVPDYSSQARKATDQANGHDYDSISSIGGGALFKKVIMKLAGKVRWQAGLVFEREVGNGQRSFDFKPHYQVTLKNPEYAKSTNDKVYDAFDGFRSQHIHLSIAVVAPKDRDWTVTNLTPASTYNTVHLSPRFFTHFFTWWSLFSGVMSLPIRQGRLWPGLEKSSKKFSRHLATIKYSLLLSPLFMSHVYKHKDAEDYDVETVSATGLKIRLDSFMLDLHQRREEFATQVKGRQEQTKTTGMRINQVQLDFISADIRAVSANISGTTARDLRLATEESLASYQQRSATVDMSKFTIPDNDFQWIDMDDFVEMDWILPAEANPETKILPLAYAPRFSYFRQTDHQGNVSGDTNRSSPFGQESTHSCVMTQENDPRRVQCDLMRERLKELQQQIQHHNRALGDAELKMIRDPYNDNSLISNFNALKATAKMLDEKKHFLETMIEQLARRIQHNSVPKEADAKSENLEDLPEDLANDGTFDNIDTTHLADLVSDFNNRFIIHNMQLKWNNSLRNIILRYIHQVSQRRGFVYYMSRRAVKFILDIIDEQSKAKEPKSHASGLHSTDSRQSYASNTMDKDLDAEDVSDRIAQLLAATNKVVDADDPPAAESNHVVSSSDHLEANIAEAFTAQNSYYLRLIAPQIQLQSEKNTKTVVVLAVEGIQLKVIQIMDKDRVADDVSGLVQRRFQAKMKNMQYFVTNKKDFRSFIPIYSGTCYGAVRGSAWPPWLPMEAMYDFRVNPSGFFRVVQRTSANFRYDKYNTLRLKYNDEVTAGATSYAQSTPENAETRIDRLWIEFPHIKAICDAAQYNSLYVMVLDLLLYSEPLEKVRSEKLEKIMLASDFSDLRGTPEMITQLQQRINALEEIKSHFLINSKYLDRKGWEDRLSIEQDLASCEDELFFMMKAITTSQRKFNDRSSNNGLLHYFISASQIVWHLMKDRENPLMEFQLSNAGYDRTEFSDGSNTNSIQIERIRGLNLLPNAMYPVMIAPYFESTRGFTQGRDNNMLRVSWHMLEAIAGIPVMEEFEVNLFPLKIEIEHEVGRRLFDYIFANASNDTAKDLTPIKDVSADEEDDESIFQTAPQPTAATINGTGTASLDRRLKPTLGLFDYKTHPVTASPSKPKHGFLHSLGENPHLRVFQSSQSQGSTPPTSSHRSLLLTPNRRGSVESLKLKSRSSTGDRSGTNLSTLAPTVASNGTSSARKLGLGRRESYKADDKSKQSDDLTEMLARASNYMTLAYVKIPTVVLCLSYKGKGERNIEDVNEFVFRMPTLEYRNKTWSNLDLALQLKKDVAKALITHTGAIIGNKFSHHRPTRLQQSKLRDIANSSVILTDSRAESEESSAAGESYDSPVRSSFASSRPGDVLQRTDSFASSVQELSAQGGKKGKTREAGGEGERDDSPGGSEEKPSLLQSTLNKHFSVMGSRPKTRDGATDDAASGTSGAGSEDRGGSLGKKSKLLLGKKILRSLN